MVARKKPMQEEAKAFAKNEQTITIYRDAEAQRSRAMQLVLAAGQGCERREKSHGRRYRQRRRGRTAGGSVRGGCGGADVIGCGRARRLHRPQSLLRSVASTASGAQRRLLHLQSPACFGLVFAFLQLAGEQRAKAGEQCLWVFWALTAANGE